MRTFSRDQWNEAQDLWTDFSDEWKPWRHKAAMRGMLYPPEGTRWDSWEDDAPSQRAILIRAIRETPAMLDQAIAKCKSWHDVIAYIMARHVEVRRDLDFEEAKHHDDDPRSALVTLGNMFERVAESLGYRRVEP